MVRMARIKSESGIYHIIVRGINRQDIFQDEEDKGVYLDRLTQYKMECDVKIYAYCLNVNAYQYFNNHYYNAYTSYLSGIALPM